MQSVWLWVFIILKLEMIPVFVTDWITSTQCVSLWFHITETNASPVKDKVNKLMISSIARIFAAWHFHPNSIATCRFSLRSFLWLMTFGMPRVPTLISPCPYIIYTLFWLLSNFRILCFHGESRSAVERKKRSRKIERASQFVWILTAIVFQSAFIFFFSISFCSRCVWTLTHRSTDRPIICFAKSPLFSLFKFQISCAKFDCRFDSNSVYFCSR